MGCSPSSGGDAKSNSAKNKNHGTVDVEDPVSGQKTSLKFSLGKLKKDDFLMNLMNALFFGEDQNQNVDVCFQSLYFPGDDRYHYYMFRLLHVELESIEKPYSGKMWVLYLAGKPLDWDQAVNSNMKIDLSKGSPKLLWKYEKFPNPTYQQQGIVHQTSQTANLSYLKKFYEKKTIENNQISTKYDTSESNNLDYYLKTTDDTKFNTPASKNQVLLRNSSSNRNITLNNGETLSSYARRNHNGTSNSVMNLNAASSISGKMYPNVPKNSEFVERDNNCSRTMEDAVINTEESNNGMILGIEKSGKEKIYSSKRIGSNLRDVSIFNPDAKDRPNPNKIILSNDKGNVYVSNNQQRLNTEEDNRNIQAPLQTEAAGMNEDTSFDGFEGKRFVNVGGQGGSQINRNSNTNDVEEQDDNGIILPGDLLPKKQTSQIMLKNITLGTSQQQGRVSTKKKGLNETVE